MVQLRSSRLSAEAARGGCKHQVSAAGVRDREKGSLGATHASKGLMELSPYDFSENAP